MTAKKVKAPTTYWHFLPSDLKLTNGDKRKVKEGMELKVSTKSKRISMCQYGLHASPTVFAALHCAAEITDVLKVGKYAPTLEKVTLGRVYDSNTSKAVSNRRTCVKIYGDACSCISSVLHSVLNSIQVFIVNENKSSPKDRIVMAVLLQILRYLLSDLSRLQSDNLILYGKLELLICIVQHQRCDDITDCLLWHDIYSYMEKELMREVSAALDNESYNFENHWNWCGFDCTKVEAVIAEARAMAKGVKA